jgi:hypothetical protein
VATATWELVYLLHQLKVRHLRSDDIKDRLSRLKSRFTEMRIDWLEEEDQISVMVGDVEVLVAVVMAFSNWGPHRIQVSITDDSHVHEHKVEAKAALTQEEDEAAISLDLEVPTSLTV